MTIHTPTALPLEHVSERLAAELLAVTEDVLDMQDLFLNRTPEAAPSAGDIRLAQKFDLIDQSLRDLRRMIHNLPASITPANLSCDPVTLTAGLKLGRIRESVHNAPDTGCANTGDIDWF